MPPLKPNNLRKIVIFPAISEAHHTGTGLESPEPCEMAKHAAREYNLAAGTRV